MCRGEYQTKPPLPFTPGTEFAGVIDALGDDARGFHVGDRVLGFMQWGAFSQTIVVPTRGLIKIPKSMSFDEAAGFLFSCSVSVSSPIHHVSGFLMTNATSYVALVYRSCHLALGTRLFQEVRFQSESESWPDLSHSCCRRRLIDGRHV